MKSGLKRYFGKRDFRVTSEPRGGTASTGALSFVIQKHAASHLHYDFRLELDGTLKSWAVPKGPSLDPADRRMAVHVEDHPIDYGGFEGVIPKGQYGAGTVIVWVNGTWEPVGDPQAGYRDGKLKFVLHGHKLAGGWTLVRMHGRGDERQEPWLLIKERDDAARPAAEYSVVTAEPGSVLSDMTIPDAAAPAKKVARAKAKAAPIAAKAATKKVAAKAVKPVDPAAADATIEGIRISHPDRVIDASTGITKLEIVRYYLDAAKLILPHLVERPVSLVRAPTGIAGHVIFQRHAGTLRIPGLRELDPKIAPELEPMIEIDSLPALIGAAQANVIELHTWNATTLDTTRPDRIVFDLDPGDGLAWKAMQEGAALTRSLLDRLGLASFLKTSGGKGLHVVVPITPKDDWDAVKALSKRIVEHMAATIPERFVARSGPKNRVGKIFVDYLRNGFGATTACAWSARARPGLGVSVTCDWDELGAITSGAQWTIRNVHERVVEHGDAWRGYSTTKQTTVKALKLLGPAKAKVKARA